MDRAFWALFAQRNLSAKFDLLGLAPLPLFRPGAHDKYDETMRRAPFNVLILPWRWTIDGSAEFALFRRADDGVWQWVAGGGQDDETPLEAARREAFEEAGISPTSPFMALDAVASIPAHIFADGGLWGDDVYVITEYSFGVDVSGQELIFAEEHTDMRWLAYNEARALVRYDSNRIALWELNRRIHGLGPRDTIP